MKEKLKEMFPVLYYKYAAHVRKKRIKMVHAMSTKELMEMDARLYKSSVGQDLDWNCLTRYTEKMQWAKIFDKDERKVLLSDKYRVRKWVKEKIGEEYLVPLLGVWKNANEIDFEKLPNQFVLKTNCGSGDVIIVKDKNKLTAKDIKKYKAKLNFYLGSDYSCTSCEMHYRKIKPCIIAETFLNSKLSDLPDYKFLCFHGKVYYCWVDIGRYHAHKRNVYDLEWNLQPWNQKHYGNTSDPVPKPKDFEKMIELAKKLCQGFEHVRVDFYNLNGKIYFGEMTFTNSSGFGPIVPDKYDQLLGDLWNIDCKIPK